MSRVVVGLLFITAGIYHFVFPAFFTRIVPPYLPRPIDLVYLSGALEIVFGTLVLAPRYSPAAGWCLIALLIAVFPANIHMALNPGQFPSFRPIALWLRLPLQAVLIAWTYWSTRR